MTKKETQLAVKAPSSEMALEIQEMRKETSGLINVRRELLKTLRIKLTQKMSKAVDGNIARPGDFSCDVNAKNWGTDIEIIPILVSESASLLYSPNKPPKNMPKDLFPKDGEVLCKTMDLIQNQDGMKCKQCPWGEYWADWGTKKEKRVPGCKHALDFIVMVAGDPQMDIYEMNFRKNNAKGGRNILNMMVADPKGIPFGTAYTIYSKPRTEGNYSFTAVDADKIEKRVLTDEELSIILPTVKRVISSHKAGIIERSPDEEVRTEEQPPNWATMEDDIPL